MRDNPPNVSKETLEKLNAESICDVCGHQGIVGVATSPFGPVSFAYCRGCLDAGADHWGVITYAVWNAGGPKDCPEFYKKSLKATMERTGKTEADLQACMDRLRVEKLERILGYLKLETYSLSEITQAWEKLRSFEQPEINQEEKDDSTIPTNPG